MLAKALFTIAMVRYTLAHSRSYMYF